MYAIRKKTLAIKKFCESTNVEFWQKIVWRINDLLRVSD